MLWNARGTRARSFPGLVWDLKAHYRLGFIAILETRCAKEASARRAQRLGFSNMEIIDCEGYSGGIWCLWDENTVAVTVVERNNQFMHLQVTVPPGVAWRWCMLILMLWLDALYGIILLGWQVECGVPG